MSPKTPITTPVQPFHPPAQSALPVVDDVAAIYPLIDFLPIGALVVNRVKGLVYYVNSQFCVLTGMQDREMYGVPLTELFDGISEDSVHSGGEVVLRLKRRGQKPLSVVVRAFGMEIIPSWQILTINAANVDRVTQKQHQDKLIQAILEFSRIRTPVDLKVFPGKAVAILKKLFETDLVCMYQVDANSPTLQKIASSEVKPIFPDQLPSSDFARLTLNSIWFPGKRVLNEVHKVAKAEQLNYVVSAPFGSDNAFSGLIVIGDYEKESPYSLYALLELIAGLIANAMDQAILAQNLRREIDTELQRQGLYHQVLENAREGILILSQSFTILEMNPAAEIALGYSNSEVLGKMVEDVLIGTERLLPALEQMRLGTPVRDLPDLKLHRRNGEAFSAAIQILPVLHNETRVGSIVFFSDVSENEQIRARAQLLQQQAFLGQFTGAIAHEIRDPLNGISIALQILHRRLDMDDATRKLLGDIEHEADRLSRHAQSLLDYSKAKEAVEVNLSNVVRRVIERRRPKAMRCGVEMLYDVPDKDFLVYGDHMSLEQVFTNLVNNAIDAMEKTGGTLRVRMSLNQSLRNHPMVEVLVSDTGPGIPDDVKERIFEMFVTTKAHGNGIGLAITKQIVTDHHGEITVDSIPGGTVFRVCLPIPTRAIEKGEGK